MSTIPEPVAVEARAEIMWGKPPEKVLAFLETKGVERAVAQAYLQEVLEEKAADTRSEGRAKIWKGVGLVLIPVAYYGFVLWSGYIMVKLMAGLVVVGAYGFFMLMKGIGMATQRAARVGEPVAQTP